MLLTTSACIAKPANGAMGSVRCGVCTATEPTLILSTITPSNGSSSTQAGVSPDSSTPLNGLLLGLCNSGRSELSRRSAHDLHEPFLEAVVDSDSKALLFRSSQAEMGLRWQAYSLLTRKVLTLPTVNWCQLIGRVLDRICAHRLVPCDPCPLQVTVHPRRSLNQLVAVLT